MEAAAGGERFALRDPRDGTPRGEVDARALLRQIAHDAWTTGDPGLIFLDTINHTNPTPALGAIEATNPCGEVPLLPWEACTLGSINVALFWDADHGDVDWDALRETVRIAVRFLDNVVEVNEFPVPQITEAVRGNRKIGVGLMGWADLLVAAGLPYASEEALALAGRLMSTVSTTAAARMGIQRNRRMILLLPFPRGGQAVNLAARGGNHHLAARFARAVRRRRRKVQRGKRFFPPTRPTDTTPSPRRVRRPGPAPGSR